MQPRDEWWYLVDMSPSNQTEVFNGSGRGWDPNGRTCKRHASQSYPFTAFHRLHPAKYGFVMMDSVNWRRTAMKRARASTQSRQKWTRLNYTMQEIWALWNRFHILSRHNSMQISPISPVKSSSNSNCVPPCDWTCWMLNTNGDLRQ